MPLLKECAVSTITTIGETSDRTAEPNTDVYSDNTHTGIAAVLAPAHATVPGETAYEMTIHEDYPDTGTPRFRNELRTRDHAILGPAIIFSYTVELGADFVANMPDRHVLWQFLDTPVYVPHNYLRAGNKNFYFQHDIGDNNGNPYTKRIDLGPYSAGIHKFIFYIYLSEDPSQGRVKIWKDGQVARCYEDFSTNKTIVSTVGGSHYDYPVAETGTFPNQVVDDGVTCSLADYHGRTLPNGSTMDFTQIRWQMGIYQPSGVWQLPTSSLTIWISNLKWAIIGPGETEDNILYLLSNGDMGTPLIVDPDPDPDPDPGGNYNVIPGTFKMRWRK